jgi:hypothetical protein
VEEQWWEVTDKDLPEGFRLILIHALELCGAVLAGDPEAELLERAEIMFVLVTEHVEIGGD